MSVFQLDHQLQRDTHTLIENDQFHLLLHRNAAVCWLILVPHTEVIEFCHLSSDLQQMICRMMQRLSDYLLTSQGSDKINLGMIGNVVSQFHVHVVGRFHDDPYWPDPVWGKHLVNEYEPSQVNDIKQQITVLFERNE